LTTDQKIDLQFNYSQNDRTLIISEKPAEVVREAVYVGKDGLATAFFCYSRMGGEETVGPNVE
jgi:hypothetical protein